MFTLLKSSIRPSLILLAALSAITGIIYPIATTLLGGALFPQQAAGSIVHQHKRAAGSSLIAQSFQSPRYFWPRPSAADYNGASSGGSNLGPTNPALLDAMRSRAKALRAAAPSADLPASASSAASAKLVKSSGDNSLLPVDLLTASASGLDPHITPDAAFWQAPRVARERRIAREGVEALIRSRIEGRTLGFLGEPRVNVLELNLALDTLSDGI